MAREKILKDGSRVLEESNGQRTWLTYLDTHKQTLEDLQEAGSARIRVTQLDQWSATGQDVSAIIGDTRLTCETDLDSFPPRGTVWYYGGKLWKCSYDAS